MVEGMKPERLLFAKLRYVKLRDVSMVEGMKP